MFDAHQTNFDNLLKRTAAYREQEAQSLERGVLLTVLSRIGQGSRVILTHDIAQRDNLRVGRHDGVVAVVESLKGHPLFAHVTLTRSERSPIAALVTEMLEEPINFLA